MPSKFTAKRSEDDAAELAKRLGIKLLRVPIGDVADAYDRALAGVFKGRRPDVTEENLQARIRGNTLMALSNKFGWLVLTTGNKSEVSVGYNTLYGDTAGGFAVLKDVPKTMVYALSRDRNERAIRAGKAAPIPESTLTRPPTAELRPNQRDEDSLPPYAVLDPDPRGLRRAGPLARGPGQRGNPARPGGPGRADGRRERVQAPPVAPGDQGDSAGVRARSTTADQPRLPARGGRGSHRIRGPEGTREAAREGCREGPGSSIPRAKRNLGPLIPHVRDGIRRPRGRILIPPSQWEMNWAPPQGPLSRPGLLLDPCKSMQRLLAWRILHA